MPREVVTRRSSKSNARNVLPSSCATDDPVQKLEINSPRPANCSTPVSEPKKRGRKPKNVSFTNTSMLENTGDCQSFTDSCSENLICRNMLADVKNESVSSESSLVNNDAVVGKSVKCSTNEDDASTSRRDRKKCKGISCSNLSGIEYLSDPENSPDGVKAQNSGTLPEMKRKLGRPRKVSEVDNVSKTDRKLSSCDGSGSALLPSGTESCSERANGHCVSSEPANERQKRSRRRSAILNDYVCEGSSTAAATPKRPVTLTEVTSRRKQKPSRNHSSSVNKLSKSLPVISETQTTERTPRQRGQKRKAETSSDTEEDSNIVGNDRLQASLVKGISCVHCALKVKSKKNLADHMAIKHHRVWSADEPEGTFAPRKIFQRFKRISCLRCSRGFTCFSAFDQHAKFCGRENETQTCEICGTEIPVYRVQYHKRYYHRQKVDIAETQAKDTQTECEVDETSGRVKRKAAMRARTKLREFVQEEFDGKSLKQLSQLTPSYLCDKKLPDKFLNKCHTFLVKSKLLRCCNEGCELEFNDVDSYASHLFDCLHRSEYFNCSSGDSFICLCCGHTCDDERAMELHASKHTENDVASATDSESSQNSFGSGSESSSESEALSDDEDSEKRHVGQAGKWKSSAVRDEYIERVVDYYQRCQTCVILKDWRPTAERFKSIASVDDIRCMPVNQNISYSIQTSKDNVINVEPLALFNSFIHEDTINVNVGGPVWSAAWCPVGLGQQCRQYLCVYTHRTAAELHKIESCLQSDVLLQLYDFGHLLDNRKSVVQPRLATGLIVDCGAVWEMKWCPYGALEVIQNDTTVSEPSRLGLLAVASESGAVHVVSLPHPATSENPDMLSTEFYRVIPYATLTQHFKKSSCLCLDWSVSAEHVQIVAGFADGSVSLWDLTSSSSLLKSYTNEGLTTTLLPFRTVSCHTWPVMGVAFCPYFQHIFATGSADRSLKLLDVRELERPLVFQRNRLIAARMGDGRADNEDDDGDDKDGGKTKANTEGKGRSHAVFTRKVVWPVSEMDKFCSSSDECYSYETNRCSVDRIEESTIRPRSITPHNGCIWGMSVNNWLNVLASCDSAGAVVISAMPGHSTKHLSRLRKIIFISELVADKSNVNCVKEEPDQEITCIPKQTGILFKDYCNKWKYPKTLCASKNMPHDDVINSIPAAQHVVAWNPNIGSHHWLAVGGHSGLLRVVRVQTPESNQISQIINKLLLTSKAS